MNKFLKILWKKNIPVTHPTTVTSSPFLNLSLVIHAFLLRLHLLTDSIFFSFTFYFLLLFFSSFRVVPSFLLSRHPFYFYFYFSFSQVVFFPSFSFCKVPANQHTSRCLGPNPHASPSKSQKMTSSSLSFKPKYNITGRVVFVVNQAWVKL